MTPPEPLASEHSALSSQPYLFVDATKPDAGDGVRLRQLPCPTLGIAAPGAEGGLAQACDVVLASEDEAAPLIANIERSPIAAAVLVQVLRLTESLPIPDAMTVESLAYSTLQAGPEFRRWLEANRAAAPAQAMDEGPAVVLSREDDALDLELNRPSIRNGMTVEMRDALGEALQLVLADDSIRRVRLSGRGKCFSTGGDLTEFGTAPDPATAHIVRSLSVPGRLLAQCADRVEVRVHGACIGSGIEFPAFAGRLVAAPDAYFQLPELRFGLIPGAGGCVGIPRRIGRQRTAWLALSGKRIDAQTAHEWGLVDELAP
ncbi:MAG: enoyl-CoA hydratase/isomerase family protein [Gammaproteobacteria bacterium]|nr:enoyl-CoA hydratase/isomerase family protein [Gammaproteobacteria bacterium]